MRCLNCRQDGIALTTEVCPKCGVYLPSLMRDLLPPGTLLRDGEYRLDYALGQGGFGITYRAFDVNLERPVAIKEFFPQDFVHRENATGRITVPAADGEAYLRWLQRFEREGRILARLHHPGIVKIYSFFRERETAYLVMELLWGGTLADELNAQPGKQLSERRVVEVMTAVASALDTVHQEGVFHLDLKPDNVMVTKDGRIILVDFGSARQDLSGMTSSRSKKSTSAFTMEYAPPELIGGKTVRAPSDLFELGMMLHEMLTGQRPESAWNRFMRDTWSSETLAEPWRDIVTAALKLLPEERPQSVKLWWQTYSDFVNRQIRQEAALKAEAEVAERRKAEQVKQVQARQETEARAQQEAEAQQKKAAEQRQQEQEQRTVAEQQHQAAEAERLRHTGEARSNTVPPPTTTVPEPAGILNQQALSLGGLGHQQSGTIVQTFSFEVVTVNEAGQTVTREQKSARFFTENLGNGAILEMVEIPGGEFMMGSLGGELQRSEREGPQNRVTVPSFYIGRFTVTQAQWQAVMGNNPAVFNARGGNQPIEAISWNDAKEFCLKLRQQTGRDYRLPSEAEWEYACRAGTTTPFHFGLTITPELANYDGNFTYGSGSQGQYRQQTTPVGSFPANAFGLHDMHGNVWEWCEDVYHGSYADAPTDGTAWVTGDSAYRMMRGGSWVSPPEVCRSAYRDDDYPGLRYGNLGLRVACSAPEL